MQNVYPHTEHISRLYTLRSIFADLISLSWCKMTLDNVLLEPTLNTVKGLMIMDNNGVRILSKYYDPEIFPNVAAQKKFEKTLFQKTHKVN